MNIKSERDIKWIDDFDKMKESVFERLLHTDQAIFTKTYFSLSQSLIDFSQPFIIKDQDDLEVKLKNSKNHYLWGGLPRDDIFSIKVGNFESQMTSRNYSNFMGLINFLGEMFVGEKTLEAQIEEKKWKTNQEIKSRHLMAELKDMGIDELRKHIESQMRMIEGGHLLSFPKSSIFEIFLRRASLKLLKDSEAHFEFSVSNFLKRDIYESTGKIESNYSIRKLNISHLKSEDSSSTEMLRRISEKVSQDNMLFINQVYYYVEGRSPQNKWKVVRNFEVYMAPIIIRLSQDVYSFITDFFFTKQSDGEGQSTEKEKKKDSNLHGTVGLYDSRC